MRTAKQRIAAPAPIDAIAAAVRVPHAVVVAERKLAGLRERADRLTAEEELLRRSCPAAIIDGPLPRAIREVGAAARNCDREIAAARRALDKARAGYVEDLRNALAPRRSAAENGVRQAVQVLLCHWAEFDAIDAAMRRVGGAGAGCEHVSAPKLSILIARFVAEVVGKDYANAIVKTFTAGRLARSATVTSQDAGLAIKQGRAPELRGAQSARGPLATSATITGQDRATE